MHLKKAMLLGLFASIYFSVPNTVAHATSETNVTYEKEENLLLCSEDTIFMYDNSDLSGDVNGMLEEGDSAYILQEGDSWYKIKSGDYTGYVTNIGFKKGKLALKQASTCCEKQVTVTNDTVFLNSSSDFNGTILALYTKGQQLEFVDSGNGWLNVIDENGIEGYISSNSVDTNYIYTYAKEPDIELYCELYPEKALTSYASNDDYDNVQRSANYSLALDENRFKEIGQQVCDYAIQFVGNPYVWGGESLQDGCDCSGFVMLVYKHFGITLPHSSYDMRQYGTMVCDGVDETIMIPGDIICYDGHVSIYLGNGKVISAASVKYGIRISHIGYRTDYVCVRRLVTSNQERTLSLSTQDKDILYRIVEAEASSQGFLGKTYVTNVILNRLQDDRFPNSIHDIVYSPGQFSPISNGRFNAVTVSDDTIYAVEQALSSKDNSNGALYFLNPYLSDPCNVKWFNSELQHLFTYKDHTFYK